MVWLARKGCLALTARMAVMVLMGLMVKMVFRVVQVPTARMARMVLPGRLALTVHRVCRVSVALPVLPVRRVLPVLTV